MYVLFKVYLFIKSGVSSFDLRSPFLVPRQETDLSLLQGEGRPGPHVPESLGATTASTWTGPGLGALSRRLATTHHRTRKIHQLVAGTQIVTLTVIRLLTNDCFSVCSSLAY